LEYADLDFVPERRVANEKELALEIQQLSLEERQEALYDIHGIAISIDETEEVIQISLIEFLHKMGKTE
jgi:hypothetical protein